MVLSKSDAFLVLRTAYKTGLLEKLTGKDPETDVHVPGTSFKQANAAQMAMMDFDGFEGIAEFLAELIDTVRKEGESNAG